MNAEEIRDIAIDSATAYLNYLEINDKGVQEVSIHQLSYVDQQEVVINLRISAKLFDVEAISFKHFKKDRKYDTSEVKIIEYDPDQNILLIKPTEEHREAFLQLKPHDLLVISDLKFLVQRVKTWYEVNGASIHLPGMQVVPSLGLQGFRTLKSFPPSSKQVEAIKNIFQSPFSYIWGPPGTGKTQAVLAYSVLHYLFHGKRVAIMAPTNNAIEQVLRGVMKIMDEARISRKQIIRLGVPTKKFAEQYPEVCEEKGIDKQLREINNQIDILTRVLTCEKSLNSLRTLERELNRFSELTELNRDFEHHQKLYNSKADTLKRKDIDLDFLRKQFNEKEKEEERLVNSIASLSTRFVKLFSSAPTSKEKRLEAVRKEKIQTAKEIEFARYQQEEINKTVVAARGEKDNAFNRINTLLVQLRASFSIYPDIVKDMNANNWQDKQKKIEAALAQQKSALAINNELRSGYENLSLSQLQAKIEEYNRMRNALKGQSTEERLKSVQVIACTLDGYIGRYLEEKLEVSHIFLDEAGYANIIKALTLFNHSVPVSFLGDHMQLPPVCEVNDKEILLNDTYKNMFLWAQSAIWIKTLFHQDRDKCVTDYLRNTSFSKDQMPYKFLSDTYRFDNRLARILGNHVYPQQGFKSAQNKGETSILCIDAKKWEAAKSRVSMREVEAIAELVAGFKMTKQEYVILTPYKKQVKALGERLPDDRNNLRILTVHGSQGREWDIVILSVVDTFDKWFVDSDNSMSKGLNLINTAVSRAKKQLIIVCDKSYWSRQQGQLITELINPTTTIVHTF